MFEGTEERGRGETGLDEPAKSGGGKGSVVRRNGKEVAVIGLGREERRTGL